MKLKKLGETLVNARQAYLSSKRETDRLKDEYDLLKQKLIPYMAKHNIASFSGVEENIVLTHNDRLKVIDKTAFLNFANEHRDLLPLSVNATAWRELRNTGLIVPGVSHERVVNISIRGK